jgi:hypothetical protein
MIHRKEEQPGWLRISNATREEVQVQVTICDREILHPV